MKTDNLFHTLAEEHSFVFDSSIAEVFDDMAIRSIPGYAMQQHVIAEYASSLLINGATIVDLGCSTGATMETITSIAKLKHVDLSNCNAFVVDSSADMIKMCIQKLNSIIPDWKSVTIQQADISQEVCNQSRSLQASTSTDTTFWSQLTYNHPSGVDLIILHFVLQFIDISLREAILFQCWKQLREGGVILLGEKIKHSDAKTQHIWEQMQYDFKRMHGYSEQQIKSKRRALEGILIQETMEELENRLHLLPKSEVTLYYAHGEFRCYVIRKQTR